MSLHRYPAYKDSGVEWLDDIPAHWNFDAIKRVVALVESGVSVNAVDEPANSNEVGVLKTSCVYSGIFDPDENKSVVEEEISRVACPIRAGTLIVSRMNTPALVGAAGLVKEDASNLFLPDRLWQVHLAGVLPEFAHYWTATPSYRAQVQMACAGTSASMQNLSQDEFLQFVLPLPSSDEQQAIATFLDRETAKIDALIAEQETLLTLLAEKRQATISHAVTKGLNPDARMKDSGIPWLGKVPGHWEVRRLRFVADIETGSADTANSLEDGEFPFFVRSQTIEKIDYFTHDCEAVLTAGDGAGVGKVFHHFTGKFCAHQRVYIFSNFRGVSGVWFFEYLKALFYRVVLEGTAKSTVDSLRRPMIADFPIVVPDPKEMAEIERRIQVDSSKFDQLMSEGESAICLLKERRSALIAAAVTGQIDVRGAMAAQAA